MSSDADTTNNGLFDMLRELSIGRYAKRLANNQADADDLLQTVAEKLLRRPPTVQEPRHFLQRVVRNAAIDQHRARNVRADYESQAELQTAGLEQSPELALTLAQIQGALSTLPALTAEMFRLHYLDGLTQRAIAERFNVHVSSVEKRLTKARRRCLAAVEVETLGN
ncbi:MAG: sigma-70 family RNA polymerase sigma factor [Pseudomonadota bacterium]